MEKSNLVNKLTKQVKDLEYKVKSLVNFSISTEKSDILYQEYMQLAEELTAANEELYAANDALKDSYDHVLELNETIDRQKVLLESVLKAIPGTLVIVDKNLNLIESNKQKISVNAQKCWAFGTKRKVACEFCEVKNVFKTGKFIKKEVWDTAESCYKEIRYFPVKDADEKVLYVGELWSDITKRKQTEEELYATNLNLIKERSLFISGNVIVFHWKNAPDWPVEYVSPNVIEILGYTDKDFISGKVKFVDRVFKEDIKIIENATASAMSAKLASVRVDDYRVKHKNGKTIWLSEYITFIYDEKMNITNFYGYATDVTYRKQVETDLKLNDKHYRDVFENAPIGFYRTSQTGEIILANNALVKMLDYNSLKEMKDQKVFTGYVNSKDKELFDVEMRINGEVKGFETEWYKNNKSIISVRENAKVVKNSQGEVLFYEGTVEDISDKIFIETNLRIAKQKAEEADKLKSAFLANMSHEIRTPLNSILGFLQLMQNNEVNSDDRKRYFEIINKASEQLLNIINDILDISKLEVGQLNIYKEEFEVNKFFDNIYNLSMPAFEKKGVELRLFKQCGNDFVLNSDENRLMQIINNLIQNSLKFTEKGFVLFGYKKTDNTIQIFVKDTGIGINFEKQKIIFERFRQSEEFISKKYGGTGLGLSISLGLVKLLGGEMKLKSAPGNGSIFLFDIPLK